MERARRSPLRLLAPLALIAFGLAFLIVLSSADVNEDEGRDASAGQEEQRDLRQSEREERRRQRQEREEQLPDDVYIVKEGDTLGTIAETTGITVEELQELNPELDPQALVTGQEVRLRE